MAFGQILGTGNASGASSVSVVTGASVPSGDHVFLLVGRFHGVTTTTLSVTTAGGLTWTQDHTLVNTGPRISLFRAPAPSGLASGTTLTVTNSAAGADFVAIAFNYSAIDTSSTVTAVGGAGAATAAWSSGAVAGNSGDILIGGCFVDAGAVSSSTPSGGATERADTNIAGQSETLVLMDKVVTGSDSIAGTWNAAGTHAAVAVAYKTTAGGTDATVTAVPAVAAGDAPAPSVSAGIAPVNTVAPAITNDSAHGGDSTTCYAGETLTCSTGTWTGDATITYAYQWRHFLTNIPGATSSTYAVSASDLSNGDTVICRVTATNGVGNANATTDSVGYVADLAPANFDDPSISGGTSSSTCEVGQTLTCDPGTWNGYPPDDDITFAYQWKVNAGDISGETSSTYDVDDTDVDVGDVVTCTVTATNGTGSNAQDASGLEVINNGGDATVTAVPAMAAGSTPAPTVSASTNATVTAVPALSSGDSPAPTVTAGATVTAVPALSLGSAPAVNGLVSIVVTAPACVALGSSPVPTVGGAGDVSVTAVPAVSSGDSPAPTFQAGVTVTAAVALASGDSPPPAVGFGATVTAIPALSAGQAPRPAVSPAPAGGGGTALVTATFAEDAA